MTLVLPLTATDMANLTAGNSIVAITLQPPAPIVVPPPVVTPPATGGSIVVNAAGQNVWGTDWSWGTGKVEYGRINPVDGSLCVKVSGQEGWQPACITFFDTTKVTALRFDMMPTTPNEQWQTGFESAGDTPDGVVLLVNNYGPKAPPINQWSSYQIPLADYKLTNTSILKFMISDPANTTTNVQYIRNVQFT
jgi:hypothetical protein